MVLETIFESTFRGGGGGNLTILRSWTDWKICTDISIHCKQCAVGVIIMSQ